MSHRAALIPLVMVLPVAAAVAAAAAAPEWAPEEGLALVGTLAPEWTGLTWLQGGPLTLESLRGKAVLVRFWTDGCPYCETTAPALLALERRYGPRGLVVVGIHHPKSDASRDPAVVRKAASALGLTFPIATDPDWTTVKAYGVGSHFQRFTSVSILIDPAGRVRFVHDGGEFHEGGGEEHETCRLALLAIARAIERVLPGPAR